MNPELIDIFFILVIFSSCWSLTDEYLNESGNLPLITVGYLLFWFFAFPYYLKIRKDAIQKARKKPVVYSVPMRISCYTISALNFVLLTAAWGLAGEL